ncbi:MAG TPA: nucleoside-diphosphate sugar epimerase/dehydratase [Chitinophagaceae bacterium]|jgi:FlaA1/EpsC-like NDP-sugar epimerase
MKISSVLNLRYLPRWIIILIDTFLSFISIILSYLFRFNFNTEQITSDLFARGVLVTVNVYLISFLVIQSYKEIIRHTTLQGILKILMAVFSAHVFLITLNILFTQLAGVLVVPYSVLFIDFFISICMLSGSRIFIKKIFETATKINKEPVIIFGADYMGQAILKTILYDQLSDWKVVGLIDDDPTKKGKNLAGIPIYHLDQINKLFKKYSVERVIIADNNISVERRNEVASFFIDRRIKVSILPPSFQASPNPFKIHRLRDIKIEDLLEREPIKINNQEINSTLKGKRILVTGAAGSIGSEIIKQAAKFEPQALILCDIAESPLHSIGLELEEEFKDANYKLFIANICDKKRMEYIFENFKPNIVFHAAAYKHVPMMEEHPREAVFNNVLGTKVIADLAVQYSVERFVMISTDKAVNPTNVMGASKRVAEMYIQALSNNHETSAKTLFITTRFGNVLASNGSVIPRFRSQLERGGPLTVTHPDITRFFMTIPEACQLVLEAAVMGKGGEIFVFDMGKSIRIVDLAKKMISLAGLKPGEDIEILFTGLRPGEKLYEEVLSEVEATLPTYNEKIKIAKVKPVSYFFIKDSLNNLVAAAKNGSDWQCVTVMKEIVPEFISRNSKFEKLDAVTNVTIEVTKSSVDNIFEAI